MTVASHVWSPASDPPQRELLPPDALSFHLRFCRLIRQRRWHAAYQLQDLIQLNFLAAEKTGP